MTTPPKTPDEVKKPSNIKDKVYTNFQLMKRAFTYPLNHPIILALLYTTILASSMLNIYIPGLGEQFIYLLSQENAQETVIPSLARRFGFDILIAIIECLTGFLQGLMMRKIGRKMDEEFYKSLLSKDVEYHDGKNVGDLSSKLNHDLMSLKNLATMDMAGLFSKIFTLIWSLTFMLRVSPKLAGMLMICMIPRFGLIWGVKDYVRDIHKSMNKTRGNASAIVTEALVNIRTVKAFSSEDKEFKKYQNKLDSIYHDAFSLSKKELAMNITRNLLKTLQFVVIAFQGAYMVLNLKELSAYELSLFIGYMRQFAMAVLTIEWNIKRVLSSLGNAERIFQELDQKPNINPNKDVIVYEKGVRGDITFKDVCFTYPQKNDVQVLKQLNFSIKKGEHIALVGESGGGKSTIISLLQRLYDPTEGQILIDGKSLKEYNLKWLHSRMGYISQDPALFSGTLEENVVYGVDSYEKEELEKVVESAYMSKFVEDEKLFPEGLQSNVGERGNKLSGGQKQRVAIARALIKKPDILILDEATSALDAESEHQIMKGFENLLKNKGQTVIVIAHRLSTIMHCDRILVCQKGEIIETGNHQELIEKNGVYRNLVEKQLVSVVTNSNGNGNGKKYD